MHVATSSITHEMQQKVINLSIQHWQLLYITQDQAQLTKTRVNVAQHFSFFLSDDLV